MFSLDDSTQLWLLKFILCFTVLKDANLLGIVLQQLLQSRHVDLETFLTKYQASWIINTCT